MKQITKRIAMKVFLGVALCALAGLAAAAALDGPYIGVNAGWTSAKASLDHSLEGANCNSPAPCGIQQRAVNTIAPGMNLSGFTGGAQAGYNWSAGRIVFGLEFDANYLAYSESQTSIVRFVPGGNANTAKIITSTDTVDSSWVMTMRPRVGFMATDKALVYVTGGLAFGDSQVTNSTTIFNGQNNFLQGSYTTPLSKQISTGWVLGGGFEYAMSPRMSLKGEYQYIKIGNSAVRGANAIGANSNNSAELSSSTFVLDSSVKANIFRVGLNWRF